MYLGSEGYLTGIMSRCRGQFVHIPPPEKESETQDDSSDESETDPENHSEYKDRASCCKIC